MNGFYDLTPCPNKCSRFKGKHKLSSLNAVANKIVLRIFAVVKRDEPFVKLAA
jgi:hypothetical protein